MKIKLLIGIFFCITLCTITPEEITLLFMNDTHSHLYPWYNEKTNTEHGGAARWHHYGDTAKPRLLERNRRLNGPP